MSGSLNVIIFSQAAGKQQYGLGQDAKLLEIVLREMNATGKAKINIMHKDQHTYVGQGSIPTVSDIHIYLEVPCRAAFPWAKVNVIIPNQEWWYKNEWMWTMDDPSVMFLYRTRYAEQLFGPKRGYYISWRCPVMSVTEQVVKKKQVLYIVGGSINKRAAAERIIQFWKPSYPQLIVAMSQDLSGAFVTSDNVTFRIGHMSESEKRTLQNESLYHVTASIAEGFGYTMAEAINYGSIPIWTDIPAYNEIWGSILGEIGRISTVQNIDHPMNSEMMDCPREFSEEALDSCMVGLSKLELDELEKFTQHLRNSANLQNKKFRTEFQNAWKMIEKQLVRAPALVVPPKMVAPSEIPTVGVVTLVYNRPEWFAHAVRNIQTCDYPRDKLVWVIVDDSDFANRVDVNVDKIKKAMPELNVHYVSSGKRLSIGEKRNRGCQAAISANSSTSVFVFMDDDDHYPKASVIMRTLWLLNSKKRAVYCSTLPMYHITKYISAINVPPLNLAPCKRVSEASMCFKRSFWEERKFPNDISVAEGEAFLQGRENDTMEIPPEGVIVSFLHGKNSTSRRVPEQKEANGCHYGFSDAYFTMISQIAGTS
jgi:hypothetical protein